MCAINSDGFDMFKRFNTNLSNDKGCQILDAKEIAKAKQAGFDFFELKENMTEDEFCDLYQDYENQVSYAEYEEKSKAVHVKYLQIQYGIEEPIGDEETIAGYERRLQSITKQSTNEERSTNIKNDMGI